MILLGDCALLILDTSSRLVYLMGHSTSWCITRSICSMFTVRQYSRHRLINSTQFGHTYFIRYILFLSYHSNTSLSTESLIHQSPSRYNPFTPQHHPPVYPLISYNGLRRAVGHSWSRTFQDNHIVLLPRSSWYHRRLRRYRLWYVLSFLSHRQAN